MKERRAEGRKAAHAALETALAADNTEAELRRSIEASWRAEQDCERLRVRAVRACEEALARLQRMRELVRGSQNTEELRAVGRELVCAAGRDALCAMAVAAAAQEGVDVNTRAAEAEQAAGDGERLLRLAAKEGLAETVRALVGAGAEANHVDGEGRTALCGAAWKGDVETVRALVEAAAEVNYVNESGVTALYVAAQEGHVEAIRALLQAGAEVDLAGKKGFTALLRAARMGRVQACRALVEAGAEVNHGSREGITALYAAAMEGHVETIHVRRRPLSLRQPTSTHSRHNREPGLCELS